MTNTGCLTTQDSNARLLGLFAGFYSALFFSFYTEACVGGGGVCCYAVLSNFVFERVVWTK